MVLFDDYLLDLVKKDLVDGTEAYYRASSPNNFAQYMNAALKENETHSRGIPSGSN